MSAQRSGISIISGTDRRQSFTVRIAHVIQDSLVQRGIQNELFSLEDLPRDLDGLGRYGVRSEAMEKIIARHIDPFNKLIFVLPEYNGSFPGILKLFIDSVHPRHFIGKKAAMVGVSDGRSGNLRGLDHLTGILHYLRMDVHWHKPKLSEIEKAFDPDGALIDDRANRQLNELIERFRPF